MAHRSGSNPNDSIGVAGRVCLVSVAVGHVRDQLHEGESAISSLGGIAVDSCGQHPRLEPSETKCDLAVKYSSQLYSLLYDS